MYWYSSKCLYIFIKLWFQLKRTCFYTPLWSNDSSVFTILIGMQVLTVIHHSALLCVWIIYSTGLYLPLNCLSLVWGMFSSATFHLKTNSKLINFFGCYLLTCEFYWLLGSLLSSHFGYHNLCTVLVASVCGEALFAKTDAVNSRKKDKEKKQRLHYLPDLNTTIKVARFFGTFSLAHTPAVHRFTRTMYTHCKIYNNAECPF